MLGAIIGDIIGSRFEPRNWRGDQFKSMEFDLFDEGCRFTDDTICTCAIAYAILHGLKEDGFNSYAWALHKIGREHPDRGWGKLFGEWVAAEKIGPPFNSWGNGSAMRVSPIAWAYDDLRKVQEEARKSAECTHNHPEGLKGAEAVATAIWLARENYDKSKILEAMENYYPLDQTYEDIQKTHKFVTSCQESVPVALIAFFDSHTFEETIRKAVAVGGDSDTLAAIAGSIAHAYYRDLPNRIVQQALSYLEPDLLEIVRDFCRKFEDHDGLWLPIIIPGYQPDPLREKNQDLREILDLGLTTDTGIKVSLPAEDGEIFIREHESAAGWGVGFFPHNMDGQTRLGYGPDPYELHFTDLQDAIEHFLSRRNELEAGYDFELRRTHEKYDLDPVDVLDGLTPKKEIP